MEYILPHIAFLVNLGFKALGETNEKFVLGRTMIIAKQNENVSKTLIVQKPHAKNQAPDAFKVRYNGRYVFGDLKFALQLMNLTGCLSYNPQAMKKKKISEFNFNDAAYDRIDKMYNI